MSLRRFVFYVVSMSLGASIAYGQGSPPTLANQLDSCRQNVIQLTEQARVQQTKLVGLRAERKTLGASGGELARYKLANLDQELKEQSKQYQSVNAQVENEKKRCDALAVKVDSASRNKN